MDGKTLVIGAGSCAGVVVLGALIGLLLRPQPLRAILLVLGSGAVGAVLGAVGGWFGWLAYSASHPGSAPDQHGYRYVMFPIPNALASEVFAPDTIVALVGASLGGVVCTIIGAGFGGRLHKPRSK